MSEEKKDAPKKRAVTKKRVVKKGIRGTRAPKKKSVQKVEDSEQEELLPEGEDVIAEEAQVVEKAPAEATIEVVEETEAIFDGSEERSKKSAKKRGRVSRRGEDREDRKEREPRLPIDTDEAAAKAWEIYQAELEEEGVSLVDSRRGRDLARRCLDLATVFCEERDRYLSVRKSDKKSD
ncbi:MAG: hypothetical protein AAGC74_07745 [Verrucomicrobiota bacterium]